jgi:hypothetical protein
VSDILHILQHAIGRNEYGKPKNGNKDYRNHFCTGAGSTDFDTCREAVSLGLMTEHPPRAISGGDHIFRVTEAGKAYIAKNSPPEPKVTRSQARYRRFLNTAADFMTFGEWLRAKP